jgi:hypothetical protein
MKPPETPPQEFQSLCRVMSGFSDAFYAAATERLLAARAPSKKPYYNTGDPAARVCLLAPPPRGPSLNRPLGPPRGTRRGWP